MRRQITLAVAFMDYKDRINRIIERAQRAREPLRRVYRSGGVNVSTVYRWQQPDANPRLRSMNRALDQMEAYLAKREQALVEAIAGDAA